MVSSSIVLITGGNTGIGYATVKVLYASPQPYTILMGSRSLDKAKDAISKLHSEVPESKSEVTPIQLDIEDDTSIEQAFNQVSNKHGHIDALINNAGGTFDSLAFKDASPTNIRAAFDKTLSLNVTSTQVITHMFAPLLIASPNTPRLLFISSAMGSLSTPPSSTMLDTSPPKGWPKPPTMWQPAYSASKAALNMCMVRWKDTLEVDGVKVFGIGPGFLATGIAGLGPDYLKSMGAEEPSVAGEFIRDVLVGERDGDCGRVVDRDGVVEW